MTTSKTASSILLVLLLAGGLAACAPTTDTTGTGVDDTTSETEDDAGTQDEGGFAGVTLSGSGDYAVPADAPIGGYELPDNQDGQPEGCTWKLYQDDAVLAENQGSFVFITDVTTRFVTEGCPDWVQFE